MKKILIMFNEDRKLDTYPYILNMIKLLSTRFKIDFFVPEEMFQDCEIKNLTVINSERNIPDYAKRCIRYLNKNGKNYDFLISYGIEGLWALFFYNLNIFKKRLKGAYFSMELYDQSKIPPRKYNFLWSYFNQFLKNSLSFSVIQDEMRASILKEYFKFVDKVFLIPNSYIGSTSEKSDFAYKKFNIDPNKKILLLSGGIEEWGFDINLPKYVESLLDGDYVLLLSGFSRDGYVEVIKKEYADLIEQKKLIISLEQLNEADYTELVKSAYIGLAWYKKIDISEDSSSTDKNIYYMGLSSGKLCKYLSCSLPVIASDFYYGYKELVDDKNLGKTAPYSNIVSEKILEIDTNYDFYKKNVESVYKSEIEYLNKASVVADEIIKILK